MKEVFRSNNPIELSWCTSVLDDAGIENVVFDQNTGAAMGGIGNIYARVMVLDDDMDDAVAAIDAAQRIDPVSE